MTGGSALVKIAELDAVIMEEAGLLAGGIGATLGCSSGIFTFVWLLIHMAYCA